MIKCVYIIYIHNKWKVFATGHIVLWHIKQDDVLVKKTQIRWGTWFYFNNSLTIVETKKLTQQLTLSLKRQRDVFTSTSTANKTITINQGI